MFRLHFHFISTALERSLAIAKQADIVAALTLEVLKGSSKAFHKGESFCFVAASTDFLFNSA